MNRPGEASHQTGTDSDFEAFVRTAFPQCIAIDDETGEEVVPVQYRSAYDHDVGIRYIPHLELVAAEFDDDGNVVTPPVWGEQALFVDWHKEPESTDQIVRIQTRVLLFEIVRDPSTIPENRGRAISALQTLRVTSYVGVEGLTPTTIQWLGEPVPASSAARDAVDKIVNGKPS